MLNLVAESFSEVSIISVLSGYCIRDPKPAFQPQVLRNTRLVMSVQKRLNQISKETTEVSNPTIDTETAKSIRAFENWTKSKHVYHLQACNFLSTAKQHGSLHSQL